MGILFSKAQQQILGLLFRESDRSFYTNEIIRLSNTGRGAIQRELKKLVTNNLVILSIQGNQKRYQVNHNSPIYTELRSIILKTFGMSDVIREALKPIADEVDIIFIFGSTAKQEDTSTSDIDLLLISDSLSYADAFMLLESASAKLARKVNPSIYSKNTWRKKLKDKNHFVSKILKQPKIFIFGDENELGQLK